MRIYLDNSVLNRPFDDQKQPRVWLETLCFVLVLQMVEKGEIELIRSPFQDRDEAMIRRYRGNMHQLTPPQFILKLFKELP